MQDYIYAQEKLRFLNLHIISLSERLEKIEDLELNISQIMLDYIDNNLAEVKERYDRFKKKM